MSISHAPVTGPHVESEHVHRRATDLDPQLQLAHARGLLRVEEAAAWLGLGRTKTYELVGCGALGSVCIGRSRRVPASALASFIERLSVEGRA
jgi:excisionase family DNA binding protein